MSKKTGGAHNKSMHKAGRQSERAARTGSTISDAQRSPASGAAKGGIVVLLTETPAHAGTGIANGVIDLPIQREPHTAWPCFEAAGVKGAMRALAESKVANGGADPAVTAVFGSDKNGDYAGSLAIGSASILLLPVRSGTTHFKWVTCPAVLARHAQACARVGVRYAASDWSPVVSGDEALSVTASPAGAFLEEFHFSVSDVRSGVTLPSLIVSLAKFSGIPAPDLEKRLLIVHDDRFRWFAEHATPKAAHIKLTEAKAVDGGALWYEETLAPDTLLALTLEGSQPQQPRPAAATGVPSSACEVYAYAKALFMPRPYLRVGGNETLAMGHCRVVVTDGGQ